MRRLALALAVLIGLAAPAWGQDFAKGLLAYGQRDYATAAKWFRLASEQGDPAAQHGLGHIYEKGLGVPHDHAEAVKWYKKAAVQGFAWAQYSLGAAYTAGEGVRQDMAEGAKWYRKAAAQGLEVPAWTTLPSVFTQAPVAGQQTPAETASAGAAATGKVAKEAAEKKAARSGPAKTKKAPADAAKKKPPSGVQTERKTAVKKTPRTTSAPPSPTIRSRPKAASAWRIQIAAVASAKAAKKEWQRIASANDDLLSKLKLDIRRADLGARGVFYRVQAGPLTSKSEARDLCTALKERKERCFIVPAK